MQTLRSVEIRKGQRRKAGLGKDTALPDLCAFFIFEAIPVGRNYKSHLTKKEARRVVRLRAMPPAVTKNHNTRGFLLKHYDRTSFLRHGRRASGQKETREGNNQILAAKEGTQ